MKVLICHVAYRQPGGEDVVFENEKMLLREAGVDVVSLVLHNEQIDDARLSGLLRVGMETIWSRHGYQSITEMLHRERPDIAHFHNTFPLLSPSVYAACRSAAVPVVQTLHNFRLVCANAMLFARGGPCERCIGATPLPALYHRCYRDSVAATAAVVLMQVFHRLRGTFKSDVDCYLALTDFAKSRFVQAGFPEDLISVKPNYLPAPPEPSFYPGDYALFVGRISEEKGVGLLLDAWSKVHGFPLLLAGDGPLFSSMREKEAVKTGKARMLGHQSREEIRLLMAGAAFIVVPSVCYEGFPMVVLEAFASGKAVLCSSLGGLNELVMEGVTGKKFSAGSSGSLAKAANELISDKRLLLRMGRSARGEFESKYTADRARKQLFRIYENVLS